MGKAGVWVRAASCVGVLALVLMASAPPAAADNSCSDKGAVTRPFAPNPSNKAPSEVAMLSYEGAHCSCSPRKVWHRDMHPNVATSLRAAMADKDARAIRNYANFGVPASRVPASDRVIWIRSAVRTNAEQHCLRARLGRWAAMPGRSIHELGFAVDLEDHDVGDDGRLLEAHGWCRTVANEPWHYEHRPHLEFFGMADRCIK